jgi:phosphatidylserine/phosphatidylglycerophosphate/cardiolipin synthase-like enzyme
MSHPYNAAVISRHECPRSPRSLPRAAVAALACGTLLLLLGLGAPTVASPAEIHFTPDGGIRRHLLGAIRETRQRIDVAVFHITSAELARALASAKERGVRVRILTDQDKARMDGPAMRIFRAAGLSVRALGVHEQSLMHHKFAIFDDRLVATGSYNWTQSAERANYENLILLDDPKVVARFTEEFQRLWRLSGE